MASIKERVTETQIVQTIEAVIASIAFRIHRRESGEFGYQLFLIEKIILALQTLQPSELRKWMHFLSSYRYGSSILDQTFPANKNPHSFHSTHSYIVLSDQPVQVLGWDEVNDLKQKGEEEGWDGRLIDLGFEARAEERGIDLEWQFFYKPKRE